LQRSEIGQLVICFYRHDCFRFSFSIGNHTPLKFGGFIFGITCPWSKVLTSTSSIMSITLTSNHVLRRMALSKIIFASDREYAVIPTPIFFEDSNQYRLRLLLFSLFIIFDTYNAAKTGAQNCASERSCSVWPCYTISNASFWIVIWHAFSVGKILFLSGHSITYALNCFL